MLLGKANFQFQVAEVKILAMPHIDLTVEVKLQICHPQESYRIKLRGCVIIFCFGSSVVLSLRGCVIIFYFGSSMVLSLLLE